MQDVVRDLAAELLTGHLVGAEMLAAVDAADGGFVLGRAEAREESLDAGERRRGRREVEAVAAEEELSTLAAAALITAWAPG